MKLGKRILRFVLISFAIPPAIVLATMHSENQHSAGVVFTLECGNDCCGCDQIQLNIAPTEIDWEVK